ncbi:MAG: sigma-70 domain-containing protein [Oscillospiraceae bacterium]
MPVERVREIMRVAQEPVSMDTDRPRGGFRLMDFIRDEDALAPDEAALKTITNEDIDGVLKTLTPRRNRFAASLQDGDATRLRRSVEFNVTRSESARLRQRQESCASTQQQFKENKRHKCNGIFLQN